MNELREVNQKLWKIEDELRELERKQDFGERFIELAKDTPWTMNTLKSLARSGYGIREVYTVYSGREFEVYKLR